jgi:hypothetical protein
MKRSISGLVFTGLIGLSAQVLADDSASMMQQQNTMKECVARHKAKDANMADADIKAACKKEMDMKKTGNDLTSAPPVPPPRN